jgi:hypothetical protein
MLALFAALPPVFFLVYSSTLKMEVVCSSELSVDIYWATWRYAPEESTHHICDCEKFTKWFALLSTWFSDNCKPFSSFEV